MRKRENERERERESIEKKEKEGNIMSNTELEIEYMGMLSWIGSSVYYPDVYQPHMSIFHHTVMSENNLRIAYIS